MLSRPASILRARPRTNASASSRVHMSNDTAAAICFASAHDRPRARLQRAEHPRSPASAAVELWATCPRVIGQETGLRKPRSVARHWGSKHGNRRFRLLNGRVDCAAGHFHGPVTGTRAEHHGVNASVWKMSPGNRTFNSHTAASGSAGLSGTVRWVWTWQLPLVDCWNQSESGHM